MGEALEDYLEAILILSNQNKAARLQRIIS